MTEKTKPKTAKKRPKNAPGEQSVLGNLPATRPNRLARRHDEPAKVEATAKTETTAEAPAPAAPASTEPRATEPAKKAGTRSMKPAAPRRTAKAKPATAKRTRQAPKAVAAADAPKSFARTAAAEQAATPEAASASKTFDRTAAGEQAATPEAAPAPKTFDRTAAADRAASRRSRPRPVRSGSPALEPPERREPNPPPSNGGVPQGTELVTTAIQAAGELTKIGITVGGQILKRTLDRLPRR